MNPPQVERSENELSPRSLPLDQRTYPFSRNGVKDQVSALNKLWADLNHEWIPYRPPPHSQELSVTGAAKTWCERSLFILDDLDFLLSFLESLSNSCLTWNSCSKTPNCNSNCL